RQVFGNKAFGTGILIQEVHDFLALAGISFPFVTTIDRAPLAGRRGLLCHSILPPQTITNSRKLRHLSPRLYLRRGDANHQITRKTEVHEMVLRVAFAQEFQGTSVLVFGLDGGSRPTY